MKIAPIQIRNEDVVRDIRELAHLTRRPITDAVAAAVRGELDRVQRVFANDREARLKAIKTAVRQFKQAPIVATMLGDDDLYDEDGLPR
jgi:hypothetical protein